MNDAWLRLAAPLIEEISEERLQRMNDQYDELSRIKAVCATLDGGDA